jgi:His Kinase A (phospho-acceptor) domain
MERWLENFANTNFLRSTDTAHDLKTPLNVAVLNLELLRMRVRKLTDGADDAKLNEYASSIEMELRRMARIFDSFFLLSTPPKGEGPPERLDVAAISAEEAEGCRVRIAPLPATTLFAHEARIREGFRLLFAAATKLFSGKLESGAAREGDRTVVTIMGNRPTGDFEPSKLFKFYYTDALGNPDLALATARLIFETYGAELNASEESDKVVVRLTLPPGE